MIRARIALAATLLAGGLLAPLAHAGDPVTPVTGRGVVGGGDLVDRCYAEGSQEIDDPGYKLCRSLQAVVWGAAAACRTPERSAPDAARSVPAEPAPETEHCAVFDGRDIGEQQIAAYERSWVHRALALQRGLDATAPLWEEQILH